MKETLGFSVVFSFLNVCEGLKICKRWSWVSPLERKRAYKIMSILKKLKLNKNMKSLSTWQFWANVLPIVKAIKAYAVPIL